jgi:hypothetical protein
MPRQIIGFRNDVLGVLQLVGIEFGLVPGLLSLEIFENIKEVGRLQGRIEKPKTDKIMVHRQ